ncbi:prepilin peptidase [Lentibacillus sediminis]|uniref:prepilin peptidase n=1 Tax=Lentibacillus sediminis TaxID=1940529 RepID=UPI000C1BA2BD|nr:A24 family peptidase [Lentibacillus sediminis]
MDIAIIFIFFLLGLIFGSFFNVVGLRLPQNIPFANDRSACPHCHTQLSWYENIPLISFLLQGGKCRHCKRRISFIYPAVELFTGGLFAISYINFGLDWELLTALLLVSMLMIIFVSDIAYMLIPNKVLLFFLPLMIGMRIIVPLEPWWSPIAGGLIGIAVVALIILVSRGGMGAGDMKLFGVLGIVLGTEKLLLTFFLSCTIGAIVGLVLLVGKVIDRKQPVPFGPYIVVAALISYFYGGELIRLYLNFYI